MTTLEQALAARFAPVAVIGTIAGIGEYSGFWKFVSVAPTEYITDSRYKPYFGRIPEIVNEDINPLGGIAKAGEVSFELVDVADAFLGKLRNDRVAQTYLTSAQTAGGNQITVLNGDAFVPGVTQLFVGGEVENVVSLDSGTTFNVTRAQLGTEAVAHKINSPVYLYTPFILGRQMKLYVTFRLPGYSTSEEARGEVGQSWFVDSVEMGEALNSWILRGRSQVRYLDRLLNRKVYRGFVDSASVDFQTITLSPRAGEPIEHFSAEAFFFKIGEEVVRLAQVANTTRWNFVIKDRGIAGTRPQEISQSEDARQVWISDPMIGSFRYQDPGVETSAITSGTWIPTDHPVPQILTIFTSPADLTLSPGANYSSGSGNYSCLPAGIGLGINQTQIDFNSFLSVWQRTQNFHLPYLMIDESLPARDFIDSRICRVCGYDIKSKQGKLYLDLPRSPLAGESGVATWDSSVILTENNGDGVQVPIVAVKLDTELVAGSVTFQTLSPYGSPVQSTFTDASFPEVFGHLSGDYALDDKAIEIEAHSVRSDENGGEPEVLRQRALQLLSRYRRPLMRISVATDLSQLQRDVGELVLLTHEQIPDLNNGTRGVTSLQCKILSKQVKIEEGFVGINWELVAYGTSGRKGRICPSAIISSVAVNTATVVANRYTDPNSFNDLPDSDAEGFAQGDLVRLVNRNGTRVVTTPAYQTVSSIGTNTITLDGNFGGSASFSAGVVIEYVSRGDQVAQQFNTRVSLADSTNRNVGSSAQTAWVYGEP